MSLLNKDAGLVDGLSLESLLINSSLQSFVKEFINGETEHVIKLELFIGEKTISVHSVEKGSSLKQSSGVLFFESKKFSGCFSEVGQQ